MIIPSLVGLEKRKQFKKIATNSSADKILAEIESPDDLYSFYASRVILKLPESIRNILLEKLLEKFPGSDHELKIRYLNMALKRYYSYYNEAVNLAQNCSAEDIIFYLGHKLERMLNSNVTFDDTEANGSIVDSQRGHLKSTLSEIISMIKKERVNFNGNNSVGNRTRCKQLIHAMAYSTVIKSQIVEVLNYGYIVRHFDRLEELPPNFPGYKPEFMLERNPAYWRILEVYRDLNYGYLISIEDNVEKIRKMMLSSGMLRLSDDENYAHFDFAKSQDYELENAFHKVGELIEQIYGTTDVKFTYNGLPFKISDLIYLCKQIHMLAEKIRDENHKREGKKGLWRIHRLGGKSFIKILKINKLLVPLLELFTFDFEEIHQRKPNFLPLLRNKNIYYLIPSHILSQSYEKVIDKILSSNEILINNDYGKKGLVFESTVRNAIKRCGYKIGTIERDDAKEIPEIDGVILLSDSNILLLEMKCTVKPEEREDAYSFAENHMAKAIDQLRVRKNFLETRAKDAENRLGFKIAGKRVTCMVVSNHSYFSGLALALSNESAAHFIDYNLFKKILVDKRVPQWTYNTRSSSYIRNEIALTNDAELLTALCNPLLFLKEIEKTFVQISEYGAAYEISNAPFIDFDQSEINRIKNKRASF